MLTYHKEKRLELCALGCRVVSRVYNTFRFKSEHVLPFPRAFPVHTDSEVHGVTVTLFWLPGLD
jgi:hypothetical protein